MAMETDGTGSTVMAGTMATEGTLGAPEGTAVVELELVAEDRYVDRTPLARGGMGAITVARDRRLNRRVALKQLVESTPSLRSRFEREALLTARLEHPSIVTIHECGRWPSGEPFYAMRLVQGRSLEKLFAAAPTRAQRLAYVANVLAVADAMGYAHRQHIIHRDLKPHNVMVGDFGETVVIDWGLAKDLADDDDRGVGPGSGEAGETVAGSVLGTPAYMPPEQAHGEPVDETADVYSIGAMLYQVLAGVPPYTGSPAEILAAVRSGPPPAVTSREPDLPADLVAIVERAMSRDPDARYSNAQALAEDLRRFTTGRLVSAHRYSTIELVRRWLRRHRAAVAVGAAAIIVLAIGATIAVRGIVAERDEANAQHELAEVHRHEAEDLVGFVVSDLAKKLNDVGRIDLAEEPARRAVAYYNGVAARGEPLQLGAALAHRQLGTSLMIQHKYDEALVELQAAQRYLAPAGTDLENDLQHVEIAGNIGQVLLLHNDVNGARARYAQAIDVIAKSSHRDDPRMKYDEAYTRIRLGVVDEQLADVTAALADYGAAQVALEALVAQNPKKVEWQIELTSARAHVADVQTARGVDARPLYRSVVDGARAVLALRPIPKSRWQLIYSLAKLAAAEIDHDNPEVALRYSEETVTLAEQMVASDPANREWQSDSAKLQIRLVDALIRLKRFDDGERRARAALAIDQHLVELDPHNVDLRYEVRIAQERLGNIALARGNLADAENWYRSDLEVDNALAASDPTNADFIESIAIDESKLFEVARARHDAAAELAHAHATRDGYVSLVKRDPANAARKAKAALAHEQVATALVDSKADRDALAELEHARELRAAVLAAAPGDADAAAALAATDKRIAELRRRVP